MRDALDDRLYEMAGHAGATGHLGSAAQIRARGDRRRRRHAIGSAALSVALLAGVAAGVAASRDHRTGTDRVPPASTMTAVAPTPSPPVVADPNKIIAGAWMDPAELPRYTTRTWQVDERPQTDPGGYNDPLLIPCQSFSILGGYDGQRASWVAPRPGTADRATWYRAEQYTVFFRSHQEAVRFYGKMLADLEGCQRRERREGGDATVRRTAEVDGASAWLLTARRASSSFSYVDFHSFLAVGGSTVTAVYLTDTVTHADYDAARDPAVLQALLRRTCTYGANCPEK